MVDVIFYTHRTQSIQCVSKIIAKTSVGHYLHQGESAFEDFGILIRVGDASAESHGGIVIKDSIARYIIT